MRIEAADAERLRCGEQILAQPVIIGASNFFEAARLFCASELPLANRFTAGAVR